jgi:hypothetical protein
MAKKKAASKTGRRGLKARKTGNAHLKVLVDPKAKPSRYAKKALRQFSSGVQLAYRDLAQKGVKTVVIENGSEVQAIPRFVSGRYVVVGDPARKRSAGK